VYRLDIKNVFTKGLLEIQAKLNKRFYVLASTLAQDLSSVVITGIETEPIPKQPTTLAEEHIELVASSKNGSIDIKERKKLAKRIIKAIQPQLEAAIRAEAEVTNKSVNKMVQELEVLLEASLQPRPQSIIVSVPDTNMECGVSDPVVKDEKADCATVDAIAILEPDTETLESIAVVDGMDVDLHDEDALGEEVDDGEIFAHVPTPTHNSMSTGALESDDAGDRISQLGQDDSGNAIKSSDTPPDTNGYVQALEHHQPPPPTPPTSTGGAHSTNDQDCPMVDTNSLMEGGIPWYMKKFDPVGTTVLDKQWTGRDIVRSMSEELSEIDDDELKGMGEEMEGIEGDTPVVEGKTDPVVRNKKGKVKKRWRGYR
jgi:NuA3 HAT complex component NTO1